MKPVVWVRRKAVVAVFFSMTGLFACDAFAAAVSVLLQDAQKRAVADGVVTLVPTGTRTMASVPSKATIAQINQSFEPRVTVIGTGTMVWFPNRDKVRHHVYSFSPAKKFDIKLYAGDPPAPVLFDKPGLAVLGCNIHDWMIAYVLVTDAPYYGKSDAQGRLSLANVMAGEYDMHVWHPEQEGPELVQKVRVDADPVSLQLLLNLAPSIAR